MFINIIVYQCLLKHSHIQILLTLSFIHYKKISKQFQNVHTFATFSCFDIWNFCHLPQVQKSRNKFSIVIVTFSLSAFFKCSTIIPHRLVPISPIFPLFSSFSSLCSLLFSFYFASTWLQRDHKRSNLVHSHADYVEIMKPCFEMSRR